MEMYLQLCQDREWCKDHGKTCQQDECEFNCARKYNSSLRILRRDRCDEGRFSPIRKVNQSLVKLIARQKRDIQFSAIKNIDLINSHTIFLSFYHIFHRSFKREYEVVA